MSPQLIARSVRDAGFCLLPGYFSRSLERLRVEFDGVVTGQNPESLFVLMNDGETIFTIRSANLTETVLPEISRCFFKGPLREIADEYFHEKHDISTEQLAAISFTLCKPNIDNAAGGNHNFHWDPPLAMKFLVYLDDTSRANGAFECIPGTHLANHERRISDWRALGWENSHCESTAGRPEDCVSLEAEAGSVIAFDTSITHRRGLVGEGRERRAIIFCVPSGVDLMRRQKVALESIRAQDLYAHHHPPGQRGQKTETGDDRRDHALPGQVT